MADVPGKFYRATKVRTGVAPSSAGSIEGQPLPPVNPPGSSLNSVGLTMPSAFTVSNSPLTANGTIGVAGAGTVAQYIRGDGSLADFPESSGGGSSVSYYLNGSVNQGTIGGVAYRELNKVPILGAGTDFTINADGYIASFITDAGDPSLLEIPGGNWNFETYFSASSGGGSPTFYVELYKVSGTTSTLIASNSGFPELIAFGTNIISYFSTLAVPTTTLALTDRLAIRYYVTHSGRTITLHTEDNHLCQIITTFTTGLTALNGLTAQVQNFAVGTTGTDFNIASATATHTFNLPTASATNRGALSSADWSLFTQAYNDKINSAAVTGTTTKTLTLTQQDGGTITASWSDLNTDAVLSVFGRTGAVVAANGDYTTAQVTESGNLYYTDARSRAALSFAAGSGAYNTSTGLITIPTNNNQITNGAGYITSAALSGYLPLSGGVMTGPITTPNNTFGIVIGDDSRLADRNIPNTLFLEGVQNNDRGYINFSQTTGNALGAINGGDLTWRGNTVVTGSASAGQVAYWSSGSAITGESNLFWDAANNRLGINNSTPEASLDLGNTGGQKFYAYNGGSGNRNGLGLDLGGNAYELSVFFAHGTSDNGRITFGSLNGSTYSTKMTILGNGNLGIGTPSPSTLLHLNGSGSQIGRIVSTFALSSGFSDVVQILNPNQTGGGLSFNIGKSESTRNLGKMAYVHSSDGSTSNRLSFGFYDADNLFNITSSGNLGIGTSTPDDYGAGYKMLAINGSTAGILQLRSNNSGIINIVGTSGSADFEAFLNKTITFKTGTSSVDTRLLITTGGNILINSTSDNGARLQVSGAVSTSSKYAWGTAINGTTGQIATDNTHNYFDYLGNLYFRGAAASNTLITFTSAGAATFSSSVTAGSSFITPNGFGLLTRNAANTANRNVIFLNSSNQISIGNEADINRITLGTASSLNGFRMYSAGNIGIGPTTTDFGETFMLATFKAGSSNYLRVQTDNNASYDAGGLFTDGTNNVYYGMLRGTTGLTGAFSVTTGGNTRFNITSGGNILINTASDNGTRLQVNGGFTIAGTSALADNQLRIRTISDANHAIVFNSTIDGPLSYGYFGSGLGWTEGGSPQIALMNKRGRIGIGTTNPSGKLSLGSDIGRKLFVYDDGGGANDIGGGMGTDLGGFSAETSIFFGNFSGNGRLSIGAWTSSQTYSTKLTIFANGNVIIGSTTTIGPAAGRLDLLYPGNTSYGMNIRTTTQDGIAISFVNSAGSQVGNIYTNFSSTAYNTSSDYRLKEDLKEFNGIDLINKIKTYDFKWKSDNSRSYGVVAHELQEVINYAVYGQKDSVTMQGVDYSKLVPILIKAIQEQQIQIDKLKNENNRSSLNLGQWNSTRSKDS